MSRAQSATVTFYSLIFVLLLTIAIAGCGSVGGSNTQPPQTPGSVTATLMASPTTITAGQFSTLKWTTTNATSVSFSPALPTVDANSLPVNGQSAVTPAQTTTFTMTAKGANGATATATATVTVNQVPPTIQISAQPTTVASGGASTLSWSSSNATSVTIDHGIGSVAPQAGTVKTGAIT
ncbi:MAG TPA: hypothetical protein VJA94_08875, partial [Candidatus Angelobacter sp.]